MENANDIEKTAKMLDQLAMRLRQGFGGIAYVLVAPNGEPMQGQCAVLECDASTAANAITLMEIDRCDMVENWRRSTAAAVVEGSELTN